MLNIKVNQTGIADSIKLFVYTENQGLLEKIDFEDGELIQPFIVLPF